MVNQTIYVYRDSVGNVTYFDTFWQLLRFRMFGLPNDLQEWKEKRREKVMRNDMIAKEKALKSLEMWKSAQQVEEAKLEVAKEKAKAKQLSAEINELKYGGIKKAFKNMGESMAKMEVQEPAPRKEYREPAPRKEESKPFFPMNVKYTEYKEPRRKKPPKKFKTIEEEMKYLTGGGDF